MKKGFFYSMLLMLSVSLMSSTCSSDDDGGPSPIDNSNVIADINTTMQTGTWRITSFIDSGDNETSNFSGYNFTFNNNGSLVANNGSATINGTWSVTDDDSSNSNDDIDFNIVFSSPDNFAELTEDWHIVTRSAIKIDLIHVSGGNGGTDTLTFEMN